MKKLLLILLCLPMIGFGQVDKLIFSSGDTIWVDYSNACEQLTVASSRFAAPEEETLSIFEVYPNPATDKLTIKIVLENEEVLQLQFISTLGQIIETHSVLSQEELSIDISNYTSGMYMLHLVNNKGKTIATQKLTVE